MQKFSMTVGLVSADRSIQTVGRWPKTLTGSEVVVLHDKQLFKVAVSPKGNLFVDLTNPVGEAGQGEYALKFPEAAKLLGLAELPKTVRQVTRSRKAPKVTTTPAPTPMAAYSKPKARKADSKAETIAAIQQSLLKAVELLGKL